jgi:AraC-like DNA-binding protein
MNFSKETIFFFSALGAFNGLLLSAYLLFFAKKRMSSHFFLGILLLALSMRVGKSVLYYFDHNLPKIYLQIGLSACFFIGPSLYFFLKSSINPVKVIPRGWKFHLLILLAVITLGGIVVPYQRYPGIWNRFCAQFIYTQWAVYVCASGFLMKDILTKLFVARSSLKPFEYWTISVFIMNVLIFAAYLWAFWGGLYISAAITFSFALYISIFILLNRKKNDDLFINPLKTDSKRISDEEAQRWMSNLERLMQEKQLFKRNNLKLQDVAREMNITTHQLSQFLNENVGKSFTHFINEYRVEEACKLLKNNALYSIEGIGDEVGFNSKSTFYATFKKIKRMTPASFQQRFVSPDL